MRKADWAQGVASRGGVLAANTGFGYGDSEAVAYSERLMADFAANLDGQMTVGQALMFAKQSSVHLPMAVVDAKVMQEATFYGLPMYRLGAGGLSAPAVLPTAPTTGTTESATGHCRPRPSREPEHSLRSPAAAARGTACRQGSSPVQAPLAIPGRPLQPETSDSYAKPTNGQVAHGVVVEGLTTRGHLDGRLVQPGLLHRHTGLEQQPARAADRGSVLPRDAGQRRRAGHPGPGPA